MTALRPIESIPDALALACLPEAAAREHVWLPFHCELPRKILHIACARAPGQQLESQTIAMIKQCASVGGDWSIRWESLSSQSQLITAINAAYEGSYDVEVLTDQCLDLASNGELNFEDDHWPVGRWLDALINDAVHRRASDIHFLPTEANVVVRYRVDGRMLDRVVLPIRIWCVLLSRVKVLSALDVTEHRRPQEGAYECCVHGKPQSIRSAFIPCGKSEKITLRLLRSVSTLPSLDEIFKLSTQHRRVMQALDRQQGLIVVAGATGSGKTTTLYSCLLHWLKQGLNLITLEDPIEVPLTGVCQSEVNTVLGYSFSAGLRAALRHDPDGLMVGEIRDSETCSLALRAAITGHPVIASVHANNAVGVIQRLMGLGATPLDLQQSITTVIVQRLVRAPCACASSPVENRALCSKCFGEGYFGCVAAVELFQPKTEFFARPQSWPAEQNRLDGRFRKTLLQLRNDHYIDALEYDQLMYAEGGKDATVSNSLS